MKSREDIRKERTAIALCAKECTHNAPCSSPPCGDACQGCPLRYLAGYTTDQLLEAIISRPGLNHLIVEPRGTAKFTIDNRGRAKEKYSLRGPALILTVGLRKCEETPKKD